MKLRRKKDRLKDRMKSYRVGGKQDPPRRRRMPSEDVPVFPTDLPVIDPRVLNRRERVGDASPGRMLDTGYVSAVDNTAAPMNVEVPPRGPGRPDDAPDPRPRPDDMEGMRRRDPRVIRRDQDRRLKETEGTGADRSQTEFTGFITAPYLRTGQVPTNTKVRNPETGQFEDRQMEPEEIADYIFKNQVRREPRRMMTREQAYQKAMEIMRSRS
jgi:hypothetical protein